VTAVAVSADGRWIATGSRDDTIRLWAMSGEPLALLEEHDDTLIGLSFLADPPALVALSFDGTLSLRSLDGRTGRPGRDLRMRPGIGYSATVSAALRGRVLAVAGSDGITRLWSARGSPVTAAGEALAVDEQPPALVAALAPDGRYLLTGRADGSVAVRRLDLRTGAAPLLTRVFGEHSRRVRAIAFAPDGRRVVTASADGTARVWHAEREEEAIVYEGHAGEVTAAAFMADGERVITGGADGTLRVWPPATPEPWAALDAATSICLEPGFRVRSLGESAADAQSRYERCQVPPGAGRPRRRG
jgi:WD40 repeat protein